jgi:hypothetical protein
LREVYKEEVVEQEIDVEEESILVVWESIDEAVE